MHPYLKEAQEHLKQSESERYGDPMESLRSTLWHIIEAVEDIDSRLRAVEDWRFMHSEE